MWTWESASGRELRTAVDRGEPLADLLDDCQAIYFWKRSLEPPIGIENDELAFENWVDCLLRVPLGTVGPRRLCHFATIDGVHVGGGGLTNEKRSALRRYIGSARWRKWLSRYFVDLSRSCPPVYVGESADLIRRVREHVAGETGFGQRIIESPDLDWADLRLEYAVLGPSRKHKDTSEAKARRRLLELMATDLALAGYVTRRG